LANEEHEECSFISKRFADKMHDKDGLAKSSKGERHGRSLFLGSSKVSVKHLPHQEKTKK